MKYRKFIGYTHTAAGAGEKEWRADVSRRNWNLVFSSAARTLKMHSLCPRDSVTRTQPQYDKIPFQKNDRKQISKLIILNLQTMLRHFCLGHKEPVNI